MSIKRILQSLLGYVLALALAVSLTWACVLALAHRLLTDQALYERVAVDERLLAAQIDRVEDTVHTLAQEYNFAPETVMALMTQEALSDYSRDMAAWLMGLLSAEPLPEAPFPDTHIIEEAVRADELFRESTDEFMRRTVARDRVAYPIGQALQRASMPLRISLLALAVPMVTERVNIPALIDLVGTLRTVLCIAAAVLLALLLLTQGKRRLIYGSAAVLASFLLLAIMTAATLLANLPKAAGELSVLLSLRLGILQDALLPIVLLTEGALLLLGVGMLFFCLKGTRPYHGRHERKKP